MINEEKLKICKTCEYYIFEIMPNLYKCSECDFFIEELLNNVSINCPKGKW